MSKRIAMFSAVAVVLGLTGMVGAADSVTIKQVMTKVAKGKTALVGQIKSAVNSDTPDWKSIQKHAKAVADLTGAIVDAKPPKGDKAGYEKLAKAFAANAKALDTAAEHEDAAGTKAALGKIGGSCMGCHTAHRGK